MEYNHQHMLQLPSAYAVLSEEEMTYTEGGAFSFNITQEQVAAFAVNVAVNTILIVGSVSLEYFSNTIQNGYNDGLSISGIFSHQWNRMNTWSRVAACGLAVVGGYYAYTQVVGVVRNIMSIVEAFKLAYSQSKAEQNTDVLQPALAV